MAEFSVGEMVVFVSAGGCGDAWIKNYDGDDVLIVERSLRWDWVVRARDGMLFDTCNKFLRKKRPPEEYDGNKTVSWDDCPWRPEKVLVRL